MKIFRGTNEIPAGLKYPVVTLGNFDGLHLGHRSIFKEVVECSRRNSGTGIVFTFEPHPLKILSPENHPPLLTSFHKKLELIQANNLDMVICADFNQEFANQHATDFVKNILVNKIGVKEIFVGDNFTFGKGKQGTIPYLQESGKEYGFKLNIVPPYRLDNQVVSSTLIRKLIRTGEINTANRLLARNYSLEGVIIKGEQRGKMLGFPTANIEKTHELIPADGVYAVQISRKDKTYDGITNIGMNPTFNQQHLVIETHFFDFSENIYGEKIEIIFIERIREERQFASLEELKSQIEKDILVAKKILAAISS